MEMNPNRWRILHIINVGTFMSTMDVGIVNVVLPTLAEQFSVSLAHIQWVVSSYLLTMVALLPVMGKLSDRLDRRVIYSLGFLIFSLGSLFAALSPGLAALIGSRCVQGVGATMIMANSQALVRDVFPDSERGKALGFNAIIISAGTLSGPAIGGIVLEFTGWPALFLINVPFGIAAMIAGLRLFPKSKKRVSEPFDLIGSVGLAAGISVLLLASVRSEQEGFSTAVTAMTLVGCVLLIGLGFYERRIPHAIIDKVLFTNRAIGIGNLAAFIIHLAQIATTIPITFYMQHVLEFTPSRLGFFLAVQPVFMGIVAPIAGWYRDRFGVFAPVLVGPLFCALSMVFVAFSGSISGFGILFHLVMFGVGMGLFQATNNADIMSAAPSSKTSLVGSMLALIRYLGMIAGTGLATLFVGNIGSGFLDQQALTSHVQSLFVLCLVFCAVAVGLALLRPHYRPSDSQSAGA